MSDEAEETPDVLKDIASLEARNTELSRQLNDLQTLNGERLVRAELKAEAIRAGMIDLDGLKLIEGGAVRLDELGEVHGARTAISQLRRNKPWLFGQRNSSSTAALPASAEIATKMATDMTLDEWRAARAELLRRR